MSAKEKTPPDVMEYDYRVRAVSADTEYSQHHPKHRQSVYDARARQSLYRKPVNRRSNLDNSGEWLSYLLHTVMLLKGSIISIVAPILAFIYWYDCPGSPFLPLVLIVRAPIAGIEILCLILILAQSCSWFQDSRFGIFIAAHLHFITSMLIIISAIWITFVFIVAYHGNISFDENDPNYCHPVLFRMSVLFVVSAIIIVGFMLLSVFIGCVLLTFLICILNRIK